MRTARSLLISGLVEGGDEIAQHPAVVDVPSGNGHVVLFSINPVYRGETRGTYSLVLNTILNFDSLNAGRKSGGEIARDADASDGAKAFALRLLDAGGALRLNSPPGWRLQWVLAFWRGWSTIPATMAKRSSEESWRQAQGEPSRRAKQGSRREGRQAAERSGHAGRVAARRGEGQEPLLEAELRALVGPTRREDGCITYDLHRGADARGAYSAA